MSYNYEKEKQNLFTPDGLKMFVQIRDNANRLLNVSGAFRMDAAIRNQTGDSWAMLACVDMMVERGEIREITQPNCVGQYRVFVATS